MEVAVKHLKNNEHKTLARAMHNLKGLAGTLGLELLEQSAKKAELELSSNACTDLSVFNEQLTLALYAVRQLLVTNSYNHQPEAMSSGQNPDTLIDEIYSLALSARPIPSKLVREIALQKFDHSHPLFKLKEAIDNFNYALVIKLIDKYRNNYKN
jgi:HPt (histidine-containing phosphotransfer) domain-containing protein